MKIFAAFGSAGGCIALICWIVAAGSLALNAATNTPPTRLWTATRTNSSMAGSQLRKIVLTNRTTNLLVRVGTNQVRIADSMSRRGPLLDITTNGAVGRFGSHQVLLMPNLNSSGSIFLQTGDGKRLRSHPLGLAYFDAASGRSVLLATLKDSRGQWVPPNQIIYRDAFEGDGLKADVRFSYNQNSFEQDVILRTRPPSPAEYGLNPATTRLEIWTEFLQPPTPLKEPHIIPLRIAEETPTRREVFAVDESLSWGLMKVVTGGAFPLEMRARSTTNGAAAVQRKVPVAKSWQQVEDRFFLIEAVDYLTARSHLRRLSATNSPVARQAASSASPANRVASASRTFPAAPAVKPPVDSIELARSNPGGKGGFVLDYIIVNAAVTNQVWVEDKDNLPAGAVQDASGGDSWNWTTNNPVPASGTNAHQSANSSGYHHHVFGQATATLAVTGSDRMYSYIYLDPASPPAEVMMQWDDGGLQWVEYWVDYPEPQWECWQEWVEDGYWDDGYCDDGYYDEDGNWVDGQCYDGDWVDTSYWDEVCDWVDGYWDGYWEWTSNWEHRAYWGSNLISLGATYIGPLPPSGQWVRLEVSASTVGLGDHPVSGMAFSLYGGKATWDYAGKMNQQPDIVWVEDAVPTGGMSAASGGDSWNWISSGPTPVSGTLAHQSTNAAGLHEHSFSNATATLTIDAEVSLYAYVYLDPTNPPAEIMLQWCESPANWEHRAYWGANSITNVGVNGSESRRYMGPLPPAGQWMRLEVPASAVGLEGRTLNGMAFTLYGGQATWDNAGVTLVWSTDRDGDLMDDAWEIANGFNPWVDDGALDADGDHFSNRLEYIMGTDPNDSNDHPVAPPIPGGLIMDYSTNAPSAGGMSLPPPVPGLRLIGPKFQGTNLLFSYADTSTNASSATTNQAWQLYWKADLSTNVAWLYFATFAAGQTNLTLGGLTNATAFFLLASGADMDHDGLPDNWEVNNGLNPNDPGDASANSSTPGLTNLQAYQRGLDPHINYLSQGTGTMTYEYDAIGRLLRAVQPTAQRFQPDAEGNIQRINP